MHKIKDYQFPQHKINNNCKAKKNGNYKMKMSENKIDTGSHDNLMPIKMFKMLFPHTKTWI